MEVVKYKRPKLITGFCVVAYAWVVVTFPATFLPSIKKLGDLYPALYGLIIAFQFISIVGVWHMKKWGVELYIISVFVKYAFLFQINQISPPGAVISVAYIVIFSIFYKRMDRNL